MDDDRKFESSLGMFIGVAGSFTVAGMLTTVRGSILNANVALLLMIIVVIGAAIGGRTAGAVSAVGATLSYDFLHTEPYNSLAINSSDDVQTAALLLVGGLIVGQIAARARATDAALDAGRAEIRRIVRVADLAAQGASTAHVIQAAQDELIRLLTLQKCQFEAPPYGHKLERLERSGIVVRPRRHIIESHMGRHGLEFPAGGVELPVLHRGEQVGRFQLVPTPGVGASLEQRVVAVALADQVGASLGEALPTEHDP